MSRRRPGIPLGPWPVALAIAGTVAYLVLALIAFPLIYFLIDRLETLCPR